MKYAFELYVSKDEVTQKDIQDLYDSVSGYLGFLTKVRFHIKLANNQIRYFIESDKDLESLSGNIEFGILQPVDIDEVKLPVTKKRESFVGFVKGGTLLELHEKMSVKRSKKLEHFVCDAVRLTNDKAKVNIKLLFRNAGDEWSVSNKLTTKFPAHLLAFDFRKSTNYMKKEIPKYLNIEKSLSWLAPEDINAVLEVDTFPYLNKPHYLSLFNYEFDKHSMIVGASGSGKSKFIELLIQRIAKLPSRNDYRVVVIDPHASLAKDLAESMPAEDLSSIDFGTDTAELFAGAQDDITAATELTTTLFRSLLSDDFNPRVERVLRFSLFVLFTAQNMSMGTLKRFLTETDLRQKILDHVESHVPNNIIHFFGTDYNEIRTAHYSEGVMPIISLVDEMELQPTFLAEGGLSIQKSVNEKFLTVFSLNKVSMGEKVVKTVAGLLIQQIFLLAQSKAFSQKVLLFIDEVSVVQTPALASILSEARKYNLFVFLSQQYFTQVEKKLQDAIFANVSNYYAFRVSEEDAEQLVGNLPMELPKELAVESKEKGVKEETLKARFLIELDPRECIVRVAAGGSLLPSIKARTLDVISTDKAHQKNIDTQILKTTQSPSKKPALKAFEEKAPVSIDEFLERADAAIEHSIKQPDDYSTTHRPDNEEYSNKDAGQLLREEYPEAFTVLDETKNETLGMDDHEKQKKVVDKAPARTVDIAPTVVRFAIGGMPVVDRGMPDLDSLIKQQSPKKSVE